MLGETVKFDVYLSEAPVCSWERYNITVIVCS
jgi:hypothetical protein